MMKNPTQAKSKPSGVDTVGGVPGKPIRGGVGCVGAIHYTYWPDYNGNLRSVAIANPWAGCRDTNTETATDHEGDTTVF
jgi:hypothetical protein